MKSHRRKKGKLWRKCLGRIPGARKGGGLAGYERVAVQEEKKEKGTEEGVKIKD